MTSPRAFIVRVSDSPPRVVVEDVRSRTQAVVDDLSEVGPLIERWLAAPTDREDSVSAPA
jgi:hypothetical protein